MQERLLISVYPRIENLLFNFTDQGIPFEIYMKRISYLQAVSFRKVRRKERRRFVCDTYPPEEIDYFTHDECCRNITTNAEALTWEADTPVATGDSRQGKDPRTLSQQNTVSDPSLR